MSMLVDERDVRFVLFDQLDIESLLDREPFKEHSREVFEMVLNEALRMAENVLAPANTQGDRVGAQFIDGSVRVPPAFHDCYKAACEGGWICPTDSVEVGGQGLPMALGTAAYEMFMAANVSFMNHITLNHGAGKLIECHGSEVQKRKYLEKLYTGEWAGTMCLTEPGAGSDLGAIKTKALRNPDGSFSIVGTKQFITAGEHDLTENIIYPVLARIEGDPAGSKGISLFLVSKYRVEDDGTLGARNDVVCSGIEHKMGLKGSATCTLNFGDNGTCTGELLGGERQGLPIMFLMMNEERLWVGTQGQGLASTAYLHSVKFARERLQGVRITEGKNPKAPQVPIIEHPDVRRMLLWMKAYVDGMRALLYYTGLCIDRHRSAQSDGEKQKWSGLVELLTPVCKAYASDKGFEVCSMAIQIHGGYGYCAEYPVEQFARDCKIASIYEGTNGIQAIDLLGRKILRAKGFLVESLYREMAPVVDQGLNHPRLASYARQVKDSLGWLEEAIRHIASLVGNNELEPAYLEATPLLEIFGDVLLGWLHLWQTQVGDKKLEKLYLEAGASDTQERSELAARNPEVAFLSGKLAASRFYIGRLLPVVKGKVEALKRRETAPLEIGEVSFG